MPPVAQTRTNAFDSKRIVEFYGPIRCNDYYGPGNEQSRYNPLIKSGNSSRNGEVPREFKNADEVMDIMASTVRMLLLRKLVSYLSLPSLSHVSASVVE